MKLSTILLGCAFAARSAFAHGWDLPFELSDEQFDTLAKRQSGGVVTTGVPGAVRPRLEIRQMQSTKPNQWTLFILAMQQFQAQAQTSATSYYQIAGIHGVPRSNYNGVGQCSTCTGADGYCTHDSVLFPAWHRAYLALFEQQFVSVARSIAAAWPTSGAPTTRAAMVSAASTIRFPYWDWAAAPPNGGPMFPTSISNAFVTVGTQTGSRTINNPLFRHDFTDSSGLVYSPFINWPRTYRYPTDTSANAKSQNNLATSALNNVRQSLKDQVYQLFTTCDDFAHFSNDQAGSSSTRCSNSLEGIHNTIHTTSGGGPRGTGTSGGHMYYLATAAFDPVFWLHHCNVDRIFALWQALHPNAYAASQVAPHNTWTIASGSTQNQNSPLTPFSRDASSNFWTPAQVRDWDSTFHYTYPEFSTTDGSVGAITSLVNNLYGPSANAAAGSIRRSPNETVANVTTPLVANNGSLYQYIANIQTPRYYLNGSYSVYLFLGQPESEDPTSWIFDSNLVGPIGVLSQPEMQMTNVTVAGSIPITRSLTDKCNAGEISDLSEDTVAPYLKQQLNWRIAAADGVDVNPSTVPGFQVAVYGSSSTQPKSDFKLPEYSEFIPLTDTTETKEGGVTSAGTVNTDGSSGSGSSEDAPADEDSDESSSPAPPSDDSASVVHNTVTLTTTVCPTATVTCPAPTA